MCMLIISSTLRPRTAPRLSTKHQAAWAGADVMLSTSSVPRRMQDYQGLSHSKQHVSVADLPPNKQHAYAPGLQAKQRARFLELADVFLASGLVPAYTAAAFAKRFARLALTASPAGAAP